MRVGFTGTRKGMSDDQMDQLSMMLMAFRSHHVHAVNEFHHGGAEGADTQAWQMAAELGYDIHFHPCPGVVATPEQSQRFIWHEVFPPLERNKFIVNDSEILIAGPRTDKEELRSGTWATIRYARLVRIPVVMLSRGSK